MKKLFSKLMMVAVALGFLTACEDVPAPYYVLAPQSSEEILENLDGEGTKENPYSAADAVKIIKAGAYTSKNVYIRGIISQVGVEGKDGEITDLPGNNYGNATYFISPDGSATDQIEVYRGSGLGGEKISKSDYIKVGDEVIVYGVLTLYGSTPEVTQGSKIYYLNGQTKEVEEQQSDVEPAGTGTKEDPYNVAGAQKLIEQVGSTLSEFVYVKGIISQIDDIGNNFGNATYYISDDGTTVGQLEVYRGFGLGGDKLAQGDINVGDEVIVYGQVYNYNNKTKEFTAGSKLYSLNGETKDVEPKTGTPKGSGTEADPYNPAGAIQAVSTLTWTSNTDYQKTGRVYVKGKISRIASKGTFTEGGNYGNASFYISEDGSEEVEFYCFRILYFGNEKYTSGTDIKVGDEVVICGELMNYRGNTPETVAGGAYLYELNGEKGSGSSTQTAEPKGRGTLEDPYNPTGAAQAASGLTWTSNTEYEKTDVVYVKGKISRIASNGTFSQSGTYGNASFYISEDGTTQSGEFYCFRILYLGNEKYTSGTDIKVGDEVIVCGKLMNYKGNTPETVAGEAYLYSLNSEGGGGDNPPMQLEGSGTAEDPYTIYDVFQIYNKDKASPKVFVRAYIVGYVQGQKFETGAVFSNQPKDESTTVSNSNILIAPTSDCDDLNNCVPVALPSETAAPGIRSGVSLASNPGNLGQSVLLYGTIEKYFNVAGVKNVTYAVIQTDTGSIDHYGTNPEGQTKRRK